MQDFIHTASVLVGTPVAIKVLFGHLSSEPEVLRPDLLVNDEAGRMTEAMAIVPLAKFPETPTIWLGDGKQLGLMTKAAFNLVGKPLFQEQRGMSLLKRAQGTGNTDFMLSENHRAHGDVHEWPRTALYISSMKTVINHNPISTDRKHWIS